MILHVFNTCVISGPETLVIPNLSLFEEQVRIVFLVELRNNTATTQALLDYAFQQGIQVSIVDVKKRFDRTAIVKLGQLFSDLSPRFIHAHDVKASYYVLKAKQTLTHPTFKIISTHHGVFGRVGLKLNIYEGYYARYVLPKFDRALTVCKIDRLSLVKRGLEARRVVVHSNGVNRKDITKSERSSSQIQIRKLWGIPQESDHPPFVFGMVSRLSPEKQHKKALLVLKCLETLDPTLNWVFLAFGNGPLEVPLKKLTQKLGLESRIHWMGYSSQICDQMVGFDLLLSFSSGEGLPIVFLEAGWARTPVFSSEVGGITDLIQNGHNGILFKPHESDKKIAEKLCSLLRDPQSLTELGDSLHDRIQKAFSGQTWAHQLKAIYDDLEVKENV